MPIQQLLLGQCVQLRGVLDGGEAGSSCPRDPCISDYFLVYFVFVSLQSISLAACCLASSAVWCVVWWLRNCMTLVSL
jgi:hypothetical protein